MRSSSPADLFSIRIRKSSMESLASDCGGLLVDLGRLLVDILGEYDL